MKEADPRQHVTRLIADRNYLGAHLYLKKTDLDPDERDELMGVLVGAVGDELSRTRRDDRERLIYLRSLLAWILRDVPGLGSLYREQLRAANGRADLMSEFTRGFRNLSDVASGRKSVEDGISEATEDARRGFEETAERFRSGESRENVDQMLDAAQKGIRQGIDQLGAFFRALNEASGPDETDATGSGGGPTRSDEHSAARAAGTGSVEDAEFTEDREPAGGADGDEGQNINVERE